MNKKLIKSLVVAFGASAIAFSAYKVYKTVKKVKADMKQAEDEAMFEQLRRESEEALKEPEEIVYDLPDEDYEEVVSTMEEYIPETKGYIDEEELETLRHHPDSEEALEQYKEMLLADFNPKQDTRVTLYKMFNYPFKPSLEVDNVILGHIKDQRSEFFGEGHWRSQEATMAELYYHFARLFDFDLDQGLEFWMNFLLENSQLHWSMPDKDFAERLRYILNHEWYYKGGFGMFAVPSIFSDWSDVGFMKQYWVVLEEKMEEWGDDGGIAYEDQF